jgi:TonB family protein
MEQLLFSSIPSPPSRWRLFLTSWSVQALAVACFLAMNALFPHAVQQTRRFVVSNLVAYEPPVSHEPQPANTHLISRPVKPSAPEVVAVAKIVLPRVERTKPEPEIKAPEVKFASKLPQVSAAPVPQVIATNTFSTGSSVTPTTTRPAPTVQTGGFGDPNGVAARPSQAPVNIGATGSFDLPAGSGRGNGLGGQTPGVVASVGFGNGVAVGSPKGGGVIQQAGFDAHHSAPEPHRITVAGGPSTIPVEIVSKPKPDYTEEGRELRIDGEVRLEVLFTTAGQVHVIKVLQGLGHGLDEQAVRAAEQIKFKPALNEGEPVDSTAVVHIIFQLVS